MASPRLSDSQKQELVVRHRNGESAASLAKSFGCSPTTVSRVVKQAVELETAKPRAVETADPVELSSLDSVQQERTEDVPASAEDMVLVSLGEGEAADPPRRQAPPRRPVSPNPAGAIASADLGTSGSTLAIDDADDFGEDGDEDLDSAESDDGDEGDDGLEGAAFLAASGAPSRGSDHSPIKPLPLTAGSLPTSLYMLVDKTVELEARPLSEFSELGLLPIEEQARQALMLYVNPRQAKRQCGRNQRVIKVPDSSVLQRTAPYLVAQGITRLVLEGGNLFAIPGA